jgi:4-diphosphocytidyl-2-C-methyl-D-erythritol kinase
LGGGSADAAFTLTALNEKYALHLSHQQLLNYALELGSDCPFFIINKPCMATGRGEILEPVSLNLSGYRLILVNPAIHVNTGWAFSQLKIDGKTNLYQSLRKPFFNQYLPGEKRWGMTLKPRFLKNILQ